MECILPVIVLADLSYSHQRFEVLIWLVRVDVVEGAAVPRIPIGCCEVYCHLGRTEIHTHTYSAHSHSVSGEKTGEENINIEEIICKRTYCELNLTASHYVIQEGIHFDDLSGGIVYIDLFH